MEEESKQEAPAQPAQSSSEKRGRAVLFLGLLYSFSILAAVFLLFYGPRDESISLKSLAPGSAKEGVGWISIRGPIQASSDGHFIRGGAEWWGRRLRSLSEKSEVKAIVLEINSPGGSVGAVQELYSQIEKVRKNKGKPVVAFFQDVSASGGYYLASACDRIVAHPGSLTGSIGVIFSFGNVQGLFSKIGVKTEVIKSGKHKDIGSPVREMTAKERKILQDLIDDAYGQFLQAVSQGRKIPIEQVKPLADGRIFTGSQAHKLGLVDQLGDSSDALELAGQLGGIKGKPKVIKAGEEPWMEILSLLDAKLSLAGLLSGPAGAEAVLLRMFPQSSWARLEYRWQ